MLGKRACAQVESYFGILRQPQAVVDKRCGGLLGGDDLLAFRYAESGPVFIQNREYLVFKPRLVAEFERSPILLWPLLKESSQKIRIGFQRWRQLEQHHSQLVRLSERL